MAIERETRSTRAYLCFFATYEPDEPETLAVGDSTNRAQIPRVW